MKTGIVWFRNDLRIEDNEALYQAARDCDAVLPVYCFDPQLLEVGQYGFSKLGHRRLRFLIESLEDLHAALSGLGSGLLVHVGSPPKVIAELAKDQGAEIVYACGGATPEEVNQERKVQGLLGANCTLKLSYGATLYHPDDLPFDLSALPNIFTDFRKRVERGSNVRELLKIHRVPSLPAGTTPTGPDALRGEFGQRIGGITHDHRSVLEFHGGAEAAFQRLQHYFWESECLSKYKEARNGLIGADYSSKFSAWLANGSISPRTIYTEVMRFESEVRKNSSTYWLIFELLWRDYFQFVAMKYGSKLFFLDGIKGQKPPTRSDKSIMQSWVKGETGIPFVDANMRELAGTGFISNRGRQNVASFLVKDLQQDWRKGAAYFEQELIDYDPASNWGNWAYVAGVGNDPREDRYFNVMVQAERYDHQGEYVRLWLPELAEVPKPYIHKPWTAGSNKRAQWGLDDTVYANPAEVPERWGL